MGFLSRNALSNNKGVSLIEIMAAVFILAVAFLPIIGVLSGSASDTDVANARAFAQTQARNILDTLLEDVPFNSFLDSDGSVSSLDGSISFDNVARIVEYEDSSFEPSSFLRMLGNADAVSGDPVDSYARGVLRDERGIEYSVWLFVFPIPAIEGPPSVDDEVVFTWLPRPLFETQTDGAGSNNWYRYGEDDLYVKPGAHTPYDETNIAHPDLRRRNLYQLGAPVGTSGDHCMMKKVLLKIEWQNRSGITRSVEVYTMKANLD